MSGNFYEIDELLNEAIITGVPALIVEGIDDISIYDEITKKVPFDVEIYAVENIDGFNEGCDEVISAINELNGLPMGGFVLSEHVLGIIDKDVRDFREEIPEVEPILTLNYYSIESHFVSTTILHRILTICSKANKELITDDLCTVLMDEIETKLLDLYYFSLESLKKSLEPDYPASFSYSYACGRIKQDADRNNVLAKRDDLDEFARSHNLTPCIDTLKSITKGKWLIDVFSDELIQSIGQLKEKCRDERIEKCKSCITEAYDKCLYRLKDGFSKKAVRSLALSTVEGAEFNYIVERISQIKNQHAIG